MHCSIIIRLLILFLTLHTPDFSFASSVQKLLLDPTNTAEQRLKILENAYNNRMVEHKSIVSNHTTTLLHSLTYLCNTLEIDCYDLDSVMARTSAGKIPGEIKGMMLKLASSMHTIKTFPAGVKIDEVFAEMGVIAGHMNWIDREMKSMDEFMDDLELDLDDLEDEVQGHVVDLEQTFAEDEAIMESFLTGRFASDIRMRPSPMRQCMGRPSMASINTTITKRFGLYVSVCPLSLVIYYENSVAKPELMDAVWEHCEVQSKFTWGRYGYQWEDGWTTGNLEIHTWWA